VVTQAPAAVEQTAAGVVAPKPIVPVAHPPLGPFVFDFATEPERTWIVRSNPGTQAALSFKKVSEHSGYATLAVARFAANTGAFFRHQYRGEMTTIDGPKDLSACKTATFRVRGHGLERVRLCIASRTEEWVSQPVSLTAAWRENTVRLDRMQPRPVSRGSAPAPAPSHPGEVLWIALQVGQEVNPISAQGHVDVDELVLK
jgi:hypothetical protein